VPVEVARSANNVIFNGLWCMRKAMIREDTYDSAEDWFTFFNGGESRGCITPCVGVVLARRPGQPECERVCLVEYNKYMTLYMALLKKYN
jgi:hypothetical protein